MSAAAEPAPAPSIAATIPRPGTLPATESPERQRRRLLVLGVGGLFLALGLEVTSQLLDRFTDLDGVYTGLLTIAAFLVLIAPTLYLALQVVELASVKVLATLAAILLPLSKVIDTLDEVAALDGVPFVGNGGFLHRSTEAACSLVGFACFLATFYLALIAVLVAKQRLAHESDELRHEIAERRRVERALRVSETHIRRLNETLEERVRWRTRELEDVNRELEAFSYSVSHDLRAPLQVIHSCLGAATLAHGDELPRELRSHLELIGRNAVHMGQLIEDLLELARISRHNLVTDEVAPVALVREAIETLDPRLGGRAIEWVIDDLPPCRADRRLLKQVFINLIDNALKFTRSREPARIEIGWREGQAGTYFVRDNGVGFDPAEAEKLFQPFHRLHAAEEPHGTGIGLVIVERIVTRHGGRVWAEGKVGGGAMFAFTLAGGGHGPGSGRNAASPRPQLHAGSSGPASSRA